MILISLYLLIAFTDFFFQWEVDDSLVSGRNLSDVITEKKITNAMGGLGAYISNLLIKLWFGITAFFIPLFSLLAGLRILGFKKYALNIIHQTLIKNKTINDIEVRMYRKPNI